MFVYILLDIYFMWWPTDRDGNHHKSKQLAAQQSNEFLLVYFCLLMDASHWSTTMHSIYQDFLVLSSCLHDDVYNTKNGVCFDDFIFVIVHRWKLRRVSRNSRKNKRIGNKGAGLTIEWNRETGKGNITWFWWCWMRWRQENQEANGINSVGIPVFFIDVSLMLVLATWLGSFPVFLLSSHADCLLLYNFPTWVIFLFHGIG